MGVTDVTDPRLDGARGVPGLEFRDVPKSRDQLQAEVGAIQAAGRERGQFVPVDVDPQTGRATPGEPMSLAEAEKVEIEAQRVCAAGGYASGAQVDGGRRLRMEGEVPCDGLNDGGVQNSCMAAFPARFQGLEGVVTAGHCAAYDARWGLPGGLVSNWQNYGAETKYIHTHAPDEYAAYHPYYIDSNNADIAFMRRQFGSTSVYPYFWDYAGSTSGWNRLARYSDVPRGLNLAVCQQGNGNNTAPMQRCGEVINQYDNPPGKISTNWTRVAYNVDPIVTTSGSIVHAGTTVYGVHTHGGANNNGWYMRALEIQTQFRHGNDYAFYFTCGAASGGYYYCSAS